MPEATSPKSATTPQPGSGGNRSSKVLLIVIVGIVLAIFLAFLAFRPRSTDGSAPQTVTPNAPSSSPASR